ALSFRRLQIATSKEPVPPPLQMLFTMTEGKSRMLADPKGAGYFIVKLDKIIPGNALLEPSLITQTQTQLRDSVTQEYAQQFVAAMRTQLKVKRNDPAVNALKARLASGSN
ncbi:MAG: hypothetical protein ABIO80_05525, partial [Sphingomicrobium sp.]